MITNVLQQVMPLSPRHARAPVDGDHCFVSDFRFSFFVVSGTSCHEPNNSFDPSASFMASASLMASASFMAMGIGIIDGIGIIHGNEHRYH